MKCKKCGKQLPENTRFCIYCGWELPPERPEPVEPRRKKGSHSRYKMVIPAVLLLGILLGILATILVFSWERDADEVSAEPQIAVQTEPSEPKPTKPALPKLPQPTEPEPTEPEPTEPEPAEQEATEPTLPAGKHFDEMEFFLNHAHLVELYEAALEQTDIPLTVKNDGGELLCLNVVAWDLMYGDSIAAKLTFVFHVDTGRQLKVQFCPYEGPDSAADQVPQDQMEAASRLFIETCHGDMTEADWQALEESWESRQFIDKRQYRYVTMNCVQLDGVILYANGANKALGLPGSEKDTINPGEVFTW